MAASALALISVAAVDRPGVLPRAFSLFLLQARLGAHGLRRLKQPHPLFLDCRLREQQTLMHLEELTVAWRDRLLRPASQSLGPL